MNFFALQIIMAFAYSRSMRNAFQHRTRTIHRNAATFNGYEQPRTKEDAFSIAKSCNSNMPAIILVNPFLDQNVGSVARAMLNFGLTELRIVDPRCDIQSNSSKALAAGAIEVLNNAKIFPSLKDCISDLQVVMATTIRPRHMTQTIVTPSRAADIIIQGDSQVRAGIVFGTERSGLTNEDVAMADTIITIPTFGHFSSLNLAQAVNIIGYEVWKANLEKESRSVPDVWLHPRDGERIASRDELENLLARLESKLDNRQFQNDPGRKVLAYRNIRNIAHRVSILMKLMYTFHIIDVCIQLLVTKSEIDLLQGVISSLTKNI